MHALLFALQTTWQQQQQRVISSMRRQQGRAVLPPWTWVMTMTLQQ